MLGQMALVYDALSDYQKALELNQEALRLLQAIGDKWSLGNRVGEQGHILTDVGDYAKAIECFQKALLWQQEAGAPTGATWHGLGRAYALAGARQKAFEAFNQALLLSRKEGRREGELKTLINLGALLQMTGESKQALEYYQQSLQISREIQLAPLVADSLVKLAQVNRELKNEADALRQIEEALSLTETLRLKVAGQEWRSAFLASAQDRYNLHIDLLMQGQPLHENRVKKALEVSERARARSLLEQLGEARADIRRGVDPALLTKERSLQQQLNSKALAQTRLLSGKHTTEQAAAIARELAILTSELKEVEAQIRSTSPHYAALTQPQPLSVAEIQQQLLDADTLLLEYALGEKRSYLWAVTPNSITSYPLPPRAEIEGAAKKVYELLTARQLKSGLSEAQQRERVRKAEAEYATQAALLSQMLLSPVAAQLGHKRLVIVAAGMLEYLPFAALPVPATGGLGDGGTGGQSSSRPVAQSPRRPVSLVPLIADHEIVNLPSASVLAVLRREAAGRQLAANTVAVLADPVFEFNDPRVKARRRNPTSAGRRTRNQAPAQSSLPSELERAVRSIRPTAQAILIRLPFTRDEADAILAVAAGGARLKALDFRANRATAMSDELSRYRIIHLATHGLLNSEQPDLSGLVFSLVDESGKPQDGFLRLHEIYNLRLSSELVVLSACQTGLGKQIKGEGLVGLVRGFMYAGAPRVVASLWQVDDLATAELMKRFYRGLLKEGLRPAAALRAAQLEMSKQRLWSSPYFWAAFVIQGDWK
jgi:CHAT domain-containing protein